MSNHEIPADCLPNKSEFEMAFIELKANIQTLTHVINTIDACPEEVEFLVDCLEPRLAKLSAELGFDAAPSFD